MAPWVLHVDMDQFIAAVEVLRRPELAGLPVIVGGRGDPTERAVVSTATYEAREFGVRSGMPLKLAVRRCPDAVLLPVDAPAYEAASAVVMDTLRALPGAVVEVLAATDLHCSIGIGDTKVRAKIATDFGKPRGVHRLTTETWFEQMGQRPTEALWGIGRKTARKLDELGIRTVADLAATDTQLLADRLGPTMGPWYRRLGRGVDSSPVDATPYVARGHGRETTFQHNQTDWSLVADAVRELAGQVTQDLGAEGRAAVRVGMKLRYAPFETRTRSLTLPDPTRDADRITDAALELLGRFDQSRAVRLVGVRAEMEAP